MLFLEKKILLIIILFCIASLIACQSDGAALKQDGNFERTPMSSNSDSSVYKGIGGQKHLQKVVKYFSNKESQIKEEYISFDGQKEGAFTAYFRTGAVQKTGTYKAGKKSGKWETYGYTGQDAPTRKEKIEHYEGGLRNGLSTEWYENGQKKREMTYQNGNQHGQGIAWYENGQLKSKGHFIDNVPDGEMALYYENGQMQAHVNYKNGERVGVMKDWHPNKQLKRTIYFKDGKRHGPVQVWNPEGVLKAEGTYQENELIEMKEY